MELTNTKCLVHGEQTEPEFILKMLCLNLIIHLKQGSRIIKIMKKVLLERWQDKITELSEPNITTQ